MGARMQEHGSDAAFGLLCRMVAPRPDLDGLRAALREGVDVGAVLLAAADHGVRPLLIRTLSRAGWVGIPEGVREGLRAFQREHQARVLAATEALGELSRRLAARGVDILVFKGAALAALLHRDPAAREFNDIDILVAHDHVETASDVLVALGYGISIPEERVRRAFFAHQRQFAFTRHDTATIDLHWDFTAEHVPFPLSVADAWRSATEISLGRHRVRTIDGDALALLLAGHGTKEAWRSLSWVCDFAMLLEGGGSIDWRALHRRAAAAGCGDALLLSCVMAERLLGEPVPADLAVEARSRRRVGDLASSMIAGLSEADTGHELRPHLVDLQLHDSAWRRAFATLRIGLRPSVGDYRAMPLPAPLWPVYRLTRPVRLAAGAVRGASGRWRRSKGRSRAD